MRNTCMILLILMLITAVMSCGNPDAVVSDNNNVTAAAVTEAVTGLGYDYKITDCGGEVISILNADRMWDMNVTITITEDDKGEYALNDALYKRNIRIEEMFNCSFDEFRIDLTSDYFTSLISAASNSIMSGEDEFDVMYLPVSLCSYFITDNLLYNLYEIGELSLGSGWWDTKIIEMTELNNELYFATGYAQFMPFDCSWCLYFNEDMMTDYNLDFPYESVKNGEWTLDKLIEYGSAVASPNSDGSYKWKSDDIGIYGVSAHGQSYEKFLIAAGENYVKKDSGGIPYFSAGSEKFNNAAAKIAQLEAPDTGLYNNSGYESTLSSDDLKAGGYIAIFGSRRSLFVTGEVKTSLSLRAMDDTFGILPFPKYNEEQSDYYTSVGRDFLQFTIPVTNSDPSVAAAVFDALSYESWLNVLPVYYDVTVSQKGLRNEESIEMLEYIRVSRTADIGMLYGWARSLNDSLSAKALKGNNEISSLIEKQRTAIETKISEFLSS